MVTQIQLGNIFSQNGRNVISGSASGIDTKGLIDGLAAAKRQPAVKLEDKVKINETKAAALAELKTVVSSFKDTVNFLRNPPGVGNAEQNLFKLRTTDITSSNGVSGSTYITAAAKPGTAIQTYAINEISVLARGTRQESEVITVADLDSSVVSASPTSDEFGAGTITVNGKNITFVAGDSLRTVVNKFNAVSEDTGITASSVKISNGNYRLIFTSTETGTDAVFDLKNISTVTSDPSGVLTNISITTTQTPLNAEFKVNGVDITSQSNTVSDVIDGVTLTLKATTSGNSLQLNVAPDKELVKAGITNFIDAYNAFKLFYAKQTEVDDSGKPKDTAVLNTSSTLRALLNNVSNEISATVSGLSSGFNKLSDIGISASDFSGDSENPTTRNILTYKDADLTSAIDENFNKVQDIFEFSISSSSSKLQVFSRTNALSTTAFSIQSTPSTDTYTATYDVNGVPTTVNLNATKVLNNLGAVSSINLSGVAGTKLEGLVLIYAGNDDTTINVTATQGIGDRLYNILNPVLTTETGAIDRELKALSDEKTRSQTEITRIDDKIAAYRDVLVAKYASLEAAITKVNNLLTSLDAQAQARNNN